ncbi:MAG: substrate-binding domain-containing protein, partial [Eubacteriales bacterium]|nr:substrate-binding domain-containing protein [Eubacteriales bacterium]
GSTSMEKFINAAAKAYAELYGVGAEEIFDIQLEGSSVGRKAVEDDTNGNVIGLSSASVNQSDITSFNVCLDAVVVIVHKDNTAISNLTLKNLYDIFSGRITKFSEIGE